MSYYLKYSLFTCPISYCKNTDPSLVLIFLLEGGFEKNVEINVSISLIFLCFCHPLVTSLTASSLLRLLSQSQHPDYVIIAVSGYNGAFDNDDVIPGETIYPDHVTAMRNELFARTDGKNYTWPKNIVPFRVYVGLKGKLEDGSDASSDDFLARNGLKYGKLYGFATDMSNTTQYRDDFHKTASNGDKVDGKWIAQKWQWDGEVKNFHHDGGWEYQDAPPGTEAGSEMEGYQVSLFRLEFSSVFTSKLVTSLTLFSFVKTVVDWSWT